ncbi:hypothetical protein Q7P37_004880 [Cladosporium fusiforme]
MAAFIQLRNLKLGVQRQIDQLRELESGGATNSVSERQAGTSWFNSNDDLSNKAKNEDGSSIDHGDAASHPYTRIPGITLSQTKDSKDVYIVDWESPDDPQNPQNWSTARRLGTTIILFFLAFVVTAASSIDSAVLVPASADLGVSEVTEALGGTAMFLIGFGCGSLFSSPLSELVGRYPVYLGALSLFGIWIMASALAPNIGAQIVFRFLAGFCGAAPLTVAGGSMSDIWNPKEKTWAFPIFAISGFGGPTLGPVIGAYIGYTGVLSWRWAEWIMLITDGLIIAMVLIGKAETLAPRLLEYKAYYFRKLTGDDRFRAEADLHGLTTLQILKKNFSRPFVLALEPIVVSWTLYLTVIYIVLFTFLDGYPYIFEMTYGINSGLSFTIFVGLFIGILLNVLLVPIVYHQTKKQLLRDGDDGKGSKLERETRLLYSMYGAPTIPIGLFWMAWTNFAHISIWSPICASLFVGFGIISIFISAYMYIIDSYEVNAASALTFVALVRYLAAGGMTVVGVPFYKNLGPRYTLTILACISVAVVPIPYALWKWGPRIRARSKWAVVTA